MRELHAHKTDGLNESVRIECFDHAGDGDACCKYHLSLCYEDGTAEEVGTIKFQKGAIKEGRVNGVSNEALLAIVIDRLEGFQSGAFACAQNETALAAVRTALSALKARTAQRIARGVEGTHQP